jgi:hypothetical protein
MAGTFFAVSTFVMPALARIPSSQGIAAMQSINVVTFYVIDSGRACHRPAQPAQIRITGRAARVLKSEVTGRAAAERSRNGCWQ